MKTTVRLSGFAKRNRPPRPWYSYVGLVTGLSGFGGTIALVGFVILRASGEAIPTDALVLQTFFSIVGIFIFVLAQAKTSEIEGPFLDQNQLDFEASRSVHTALSALLASSPPSTDATVPGVRVYHNLRLGGVIPVFDAQSSARIERWLDHKLGVGGFGLGIRIGGPGLATGGTTTDGQTGAHFSLDGAIPDDLFAGGFIVTLEREAPMNVVDTVQVIVPSERAIQEYVGRFVATLGKMFGEGSYRDEVLAGSAPLLQQCAANHVDYTADRLETMLRMPIEDRPSLTFIGAEVVGHTIIGGAIQFGEDKNLHELFPIGLIQKVTDIVLRASTQSPAE